MSVAIEDEQKEPLDIRAMPIGNETGDQTWKDTIVRQCICGSNQFWVLTSFDDDGTVGGYFTDAICGFCGSWVKVPTEIDNDI